MGLLARFVENRSAYSDTDWVVARNAAFSTGADLTGLNGLNSIGAMNYVTVFACVRRLAESVASMPIDLSRRIDDGTRQPVPSPAWLVRPNPTQLTQTFIERVMVSLTLEGNAYVLVVRDASMNIVELWVLNPASVDVRTDNGRTEFYVNGQKEDAEILHIPAFGMPGSVKGLSPIGVGRTAIAAGISTDEFARSFWANGVGVGGIVTIPDKLSDEDLAQVRQAFESRHAGAANANKTTFLSEGTTYEPIQVNSADAQFLETRKFQVSEIARLFGVPAHLVGDLEHATFSNIEHQSIDFVRFSLLPYLTRIENALATLLPEGVTAKFNQEALLRGDSKQQAEYLQMMIQNGIMNRDEARAKLEYAPIPNGLGQSFDRPLNYTTLGEQGTSDVELVRSIQQIYLGVGTVLTADEAREILNRLGAGLKPLDGPLSAGEAAA